MMTFKLLVGQHIGPDYDQEPVDVTDKNGNVTGQKYPSKTYTAPAMVESETDLVAKLGGEKFQLIGSGNQARQKKANQQQAVAPSGQVSSGFQQTSTDADGKPISGAVSAKDKEDLEEENEVEEDEDTAVVTDLDKMTVADLKQLAEDEEVELPANAHKADIVKAIKKARG